MIICVGTGGCGKTLLLKALAANSDPGSVSKHVATVPTTGSNIVKITRTKMGEPPEVVSTREIGGGPCLLQSFIAYYIEFITKYLAIIQVIILILINNYADISSNFS